MRNPTTKDIAEYFRLALEVGLCHEHEIESWSDVMIVNTASPIPDWLLNLSTDCETSKGRLLASVPEDPDNVTVWNLLLARLGIGSRTEQISREQIVSMLFRWAVKREIPSPFFNEAYRLDDEFDLMKSGVVSEDHFIKEFEAFFVPFRAFESLLPPLPLKDLK